MRKQFPYKLLTQKMFCCRCQRVTEHGIFAREPYSTHGGMEPKIPLLCSCEACQNVIICFSNEFSFGTSVEHADYTKIYGHNRIQPGNWLFFKGGVKPGLVKSCFQTHDKEIYVLTYGGAKDEKVECPKCHVESEVAPGGYRLLPAQSALTLIGDHVYHAIRDMFGVAVGYVNDGEKDKLAVQMEDKSLLFITLPQAIQNLPNAKLSDMTRNKLMQFFPEDSRRVSVTVGQGIVYLDGLVKNLSVKRAIRACVNGMQRVRGCVDFMKISAESYTSDEQIEKAILSLLETPGLKIFNYKVQVEQGRVQVSLDCIREYFPKEIENKIAEFPGVQDLNVKINSIPMDEMENTKVCKELEYELSMNTRLGDSLIRVNYVDEKYLLEGKVHSMIQKQLAMFCVARRVLSTSIENRLRIV